MPGITLEIAIETLRKVVVRWELEYHCCVGIQMPEPTHDNDCPFAAALRLLDFYDHTEAVPKHVNPEVASPYAASEPPRERRGDKGEAIAAALAPPVARDGGADTRLMCATHPAEACLGQPTGGLCVYTCARDNQPPAPAAGPGGETWRRCEFCGCRTNAKVRACCADGRYDDETCPSCERSGCALSKPGESHEGRDHVPCPDCKGTGKRPTEGLCILTCGTHSCCSGKCGREAGHFGVCDCTGTPAANLSP